MAQPVQRRVRHHRIGEQRDPVLGWSVTGNDDGRCQVALRHHLVYILRLYLCQGRQPEVVDDKEVRVEIPPELSLPRLVGAGGIEVPEHLRRFHEENAEPPSAGLVAQRLGKMGLSVMRSFA